MPQKTIERLSRPGVEASLIDAVLEQLPIAVAIAEAPSGRLIGYSRRGRELLGDDLGSLRVCRPDGTFVPLDARPLARTVQKGETIRNELFEVELPGGEHRLLSVSTTPVRDADGETVAAVAVFDDVTERTRSLRAEREFIANAAHELRTPLAAIASAIDVLQAGAKEIPSERDVFLDHIQRETQRLTRMARSLLMIARAQTKTERPRIEIVPLRELLQEIATSTRTGEQVSLTVRCSRSLAALTNRDLVEQALMNLALNAARHTVRGSVTLRGRAADGRALVEVADTGPGIPAGVRARAFDRFVAGADGYGLGLSIARQAIDAVGGTLELADRQPRGTIARISLPLARLVESR